MKYFFKFEDRRRPSHQCLSACLVLLIFSIFGTSVYGANFPGKANDRKINVKHGEYLARIGVCAACHTPPVLKLAGSPLSPSSQLTQLRANPDWHAYLDSSKPLSGGVPFILRFSASSSGLVVSRNLTPDVETGLGSWTTEEIKRAIKHGVRKDGTLLFLFPPHTFYANLADDDAMSLALYLQSLKPIRNEVVPRKLPFPAIAPVEVSTEVVPPTKRSVVRGKYLLHGLVGCIECHSHRRKDGTLAELAGGLPGSSPFTGVFRLGPDLPLRQDEKGFATFPFPGYAALYADNLTRFGKGGDLEHISEASLAKSIRTGIGIFNDRDGRPSQVSHTMMWQFYSGMSDDDLSSIIHYIKGSKFEPAYTGPRLIYFGDEWDSLFQHVFNEPPSANDRLIFGKPRK